MKTMTVSQRFLILCGLMVTSSVVSTSTSLYQILSIDQAMETAAANSDAGLELFSAVVENQIEETSLVNLHVAKIAAGSKNMTGIVEKYQVLETSDNETLQKLTQLNLSDELKVKLKTVIADIAAQKVLAKSIMKQENAEELLGEFERFQTASVDTRNRLEEVESIFEKFNREEVKETDNYLSRAVGVQIFLMVFGILSSLVTTLLVSRSVNNALRNVIGGLKSSSDRVDSGTSSVYRVSQSLAKSSTQQAAAISETAASMEEMSSMISQTSSNSARSLADAEQGRAEATKGREVVQKLVSSMHDIQASNDKLKKIVKIIEDINSRTKVINEIAAETRLLSFNASIEAARAGSHGRGFAVVAEEVGKLAETSSTAANDIRAMLDRSVQEVSEAVAETQVRVNQGQEVSLQCEKAFQNMDNTLVHINEALHKVTAATKEQEIGVRQTNQAITDLDSVVQTNSQNAEALASDASILEASTRDMQKAIKNLVGLVRGGEGEATSAPESGNGKHEKPLDSVARAPIAPISAAAPMPAAETDSQSTDRNDSRWRAA